MQNFFIPKLYKRNLHKQLLVYVKSCSYHLSHEAVYFMLLMPVMTSVMPIIPYIQHIHALVQEH